LSKKKHCEWYQITYSSLFISWLSMYCYCSNFQRQWKVLWASQVWKLLRGIEASLKSCLIIIRKQSRPWIITPCIQWANYSNSAFDILICKHFIMFEIIHSPSLQNLTLWYLVCKLQRSIWSCRYCKFSENVLHFAPKTLPTWHYTVPSLEHLHQRPVRDLAEIFLTSKFYLQTFFPTPPIKLKLGLQVHGRLLIATHLDQSNYLTNQKQGGVNKYDLTMFIVCSKAPWELWKLWFCSVSQQSST
jgi:hypothetical protein